MNSDETYLHFTDEDLRWMASDKAMFITLSSGRKGAGQLTPVQYLLKINLLFIYALNNNN